MPRKMQKRKKTTIYYVTDEIQQSQYINMFRAQGQDAVVLTHNIDSPFITQLEQRYQNVQFRELMQMLQIMQKRKLLKTKRKHSRRL